MSKQVISRYEESDYQTVAICPAPGDSGCDRNQDSGDAQRVKQVQTPVSLRGRKSRHPPLQRDNLYYSEHFIIMSVTAAIPEVGQIVRVRQRLYLVEGLVARPRPQDSTLVELSCIEDDAQGQELAVLWERELDAAVLTGEEWARLEVLQLHIW